MTIGNVEEVLAHSKIMLDHAVFEHLARCPKVTQRKVSRIISELAGDPFPPGCEKLDDDPPIYRFSDSEIVVLYSVQSNSKKVIVLLARSLGEAFKGLVDLDAELAAALANIADILLEHAPARGSV